MQKRIIPAVFILLLLPFLLWSGQDDLTPVDSLSGDSHPELTESSINHYLHINMEQADLSVLIQSLNKWEEEYTYLIQDDRILFDNAGDPIIQSGNSAEIQSDREALKQKADSCKDEILAKWTFSAEMMLTSLKNEVSLSSLESIQQKAAVYLKDYRNTIEREMDQLICFSLSQFQYMREKDNYSLRKKSEDDTAMAITENLLKETRDELESTEDALKKDMEDWQKASVEEAVFSIEEWDESFRREFESGLEKWDRAEKALMAERIDWELRLETRYLAAEQSWDQAFETFSRRRKEWIREISLELEKGKTLWAGKKENFKEQYALLSRDLEKAAQEQEIKFSNQVQSILTIFNESAAMLESAEDNITFYTDKVAFYEDDLIPLRSSLANYNALINSKNTEIANTQLEMEELREIMSPLDSLEILVYLEDFKELSDQLTVLIAQKETLVATKAEIQAEHDRLTNLQSPYKLELPGWLSLKESFQEQMDAAQTMLLSLKSEAMNYDSSVSAGSLQNEIDRLKVLSNNLYLQWRISEAVITYAETDTSERPTEAESEKIYNEADQELSNAETEYNTAIQALEEAREALKDQQQILNKDRDALAAAREAMATAQENYDTSTAIYNGKDTEILDNAIANLAVEIQSWLGANGTAGDRDSLYENYLAAAEWERRTGAREEREKLLRDLRGEETITEFDNEADLTELQEKRDAVTALQPNLATEDMTDWETQLITAGYVEESEDTDPDNRKWIEETYASLTQLYRDCFKQTEEGEDATDGSEVLKLKLALFRLEQTWQSKIDYNQSSCLWLEKSTFEPGENSGALREQLKEETRTARNRYDLARAGFIRDVLDLIKTGSLPEPAEGEEPHPYSEYAAYLLNTGYSVPTPTSLAGLDNLISGLTTLTGGGRDRIDLWNTVKDDSETLYWLRLISGEDTSSLPLFEAADLFLSHEIDSLESARQKETAWAVYSRFSPAQDKIYLQSNSPDTAILTIDNLDDLTDWLSSRPDWSPLSSSLQLLLDRYIRLRFSSSIQGDEANRLEMAARLEAWERDQGFLDINPLSNNSMSILSDAGYTDELAEMDLYERLPDIRIKWEDFRMEAEDEPRLDEEGNPLLDEDDNPVMKTEEEIWQEFLLVSTSETDEEGNPVEPLFSMDEISVISDLEQYIYTPADYSYLASYSSYTEETLDEFISRLSPDADFMERAYIKALYKGHGNLLLEAGMSLGNRHRETLMALRTEKKNRFLLATYSELPENYVDKAEELAYTTSQIRTAFSLLLAAEDPSAPEETPEELYGKIYNGTITYISNYNNKAKYEADKENLKLGFRKYKEDTVDRDRDLLNAAIEVFEHENTAYRNALGAFNTVVNAYRTAQNNLDTSFALYKDKQNKLQTAKEILDYAQCAYRPETLDIYSIRDERKEAYDNVTKALEVLENIKATGATESQRDTAWQNAVNASAKHRNLQNMVISAQTELQRLLDRQEGLISKSTDEMEDQLNTIFDLSRIGNKLTWDDSFVNQGMSDFSGISNFRAMTEEEQNTQINNYFSQENSEEICSRDMILWAQSLQSYGGNTAELLKSFSFALYHEAFQYLSPESRDSRYTVALFENRQHIHLLDKQGDFFRSCHIGYKGDIDKYLAGGYTEKVEVLYNSNGTIKKVLLTPEEWLKEETAADYNAIVSDAQKKKMYDFYKFMMQAGVLNSHFKTTLSMDLSYLAWEEFNKAAKKEQNRHKDIFGNYTPTGKYIKEERHNLKETAEGYVGGVYITEELLALIEVDSLKKEIDQIKSELNENLGSGNLSGATTGDLIGKLIGRPLNTAEQSLLTSSYNTMAGNFKGSNATILDGLLLHLRNLNAANEQTVTVREANLETDRAADYDKLLVSLNADEFDAAAYKALAEKLYKNPAYTSEDYSSRLMDAYTGTASYSAQGKAHNLNYYAQSLLAAFSSRMEVVKKERYDQLNNSLLEISRQESYWRNRTDELIAEGTTQWQNSMERLIGKREKWRGDFQREYEKKEILWQARYQQLVYNKNEWVDRSSRAAVSTGAESLACDMGFEADRLIGQVNFALIPDMTTEAGSVQEIVSDALEGTTLKQMMDSVKSLTSRSGGHDMILAAALPHIPDKTSDIANLREKQADLKEDLQKALATAQALQMAELIDEMEEGIDDSIDDANKGVDDSVTNTMNNAGYVRYGDTYTRRTIIDSSLMGGPESETQEVGVYNDFIAPDFDHGVDLSQASLEKLNSTLINVKVKKAQENLENYIGLVFGQDEAETDGLDNEFLAHLEAQQEAFENSAQYNTGYYDENDIWQETGKHTTTSGLFYFHVGYAPEMEEDDPEDVETEGYGEMGRIYKDYLIQQARMQRGFATVDLPAYSQKIWDDDADNDGSSDSLLAAPTIRSLTDIALNIAFTAMAPGAGNVLAAALMSTAANMVDDALFTALDVQNGQMEAGDAWSGFARKGATSLATSVIGSSFNTGFGGEFKGLQNNPFIQNSVFASTGLKAVELTANMAVSNGINAIEWDNGLDFNQKGFCKSFEGTDAWTGVIAGTAEHFARTSFQTGVLGNAFTMKNQTALKDSGWGSMAYNVGAIGNMAGSVTRGLTEYAMTGNTTVNVLDFSMFGLKNSDNAAYHGGLLELNLGNNGLSSRIGSGGIKADYSTFASFVEGMYVLGSERSIQKNVEAFTDNVNKYAADKQTAEDMARLNRMQRAYGNIAAKRQAASMMHLDTELRFDQDVDGKAETVLENGNRVVFLNNGVNMNDMASVVDTLVTLNHEAHRDGDISSDYSQKMETRQAVKGHITTLDKLMGDYGSAIFNGNDELLKDYVSYKTGGNNYVDGAYDSSADYWRVVLDENGKVQQVLDDGDKQTLIFVDENGETQTIRRANGSLSGQIAAITAGFQTGNDKQSKSDINSIMMKSGLDYNKDKGGWYSETEIAKYHGSGYDPIYLAIRNGNYSYLDNLGRNSETDISQEMVEEALGLDEHSACAITASAEYANNYFQEKYGVSLGPDELIDVLRNAQGEMFNNDSEVLSYNGLNAMIGDKLGIDNYPLFETTYESYEALQNADINSYMEKYIDVNDSEHTHFASWSNGVYDDPYTTYQEYKWWENAAAFNSNYYSFKPKF